MGFIKNIVTSQLIDVIEWKDDTQNTMVHRYDMNGKEIMMGAQLTVRESQVAVFVNEGTAGRCVPARPLRADHAEHAHYDGIEILEIRL